MQKNIKSLFVTGTDTGIGKTYISIELIKYLNSQNYRTFGIKPIASGSKKSENGILVNEDALAIQSASSISQPYHIVNPILLHEPIAPNIVCEYTGLTLTKENTAKIILSSLQDQADINVIEGVGGWLVPLNYKELFCEVIEQLQLPIVLVVGIRLGCINHAILTCNSIINMGLPIIGWVANYLDPKMLSIKENVQTLCNWLPTPYLGNIPYAKNNLKNHQKTLHNISKALFQ